MKSVTHCATRLRLTLNDEEKIQQESINDLDGVMGSIVTGGQYQIIIGQSVGTVYAHFTQLLSTESESDLSHQEMAEPSKPSKRDYSTSIRYNYRYFYTAVTCNHRCSNDKNSTGAFRFVPFN